jgi:hypothetical protein
MGSSTIADRAASLPECPIFVRQICSIYGRHPHRGPHQHEGIWELDTKQLPKLAVAIRALNGEARKYRFVAHWLGGETERTEQRITGEELLRLVEANQVRDNVVYRTWSG